MPRNIRDNVRDSDVSRSSQLALFTLTFQYRGSRARDIIHTSARDRPRKSVQIYEEVEADLRILEIPAPPQSALSLDIAWKSGEAICKWPVTKSSARDVRIRVQVAQRKYKILDERRIIRIRWPENYSFHKTDRHSVGSSSTPLRDRSRSPTRRASSGRTIDDVLRVLDDTAKRISVSGLGSPPNLACQAEYTETGRLTPEKKTRDCDSFCEADSQPRTLVSPSPHSPEPMCLNDGSLEFRELSPDPHPHDSPNPDHKPTNTQPHVHPAANAELTDIYERKLSFLQTRLAEEHEARITFEASYHLEHQKRLSLERVLEDVERERCAPFVVPALLDAFRKLVQLGDTALLSGPCQ